MAEDEEIPAPIGRLPPKQISAPRMFLFGNARST